MAKNTDAKTLNATCRGWYPDDPKSLEKMIDNFFSNVKVDTERMPIALIEPHAGLEYSGQSAAYGYKTLLSKDIKYIFILGPAHKFYTDKLVIPDSDYFKTPLGDIKIDKKIKKELIKTKLFEVNDEAFYGENSVELQIPFLQITSGNSSIIPIVVGQLDKNKIEDAARILKKYLNDESIFIISSDFTHYGYRYSYVPFSDNIEENIKKLDYGAIEEIKKINPEGFLKYIQKTQATICGYIPIAILLSMLPKDTLVDVLSYTTLGDMTGDFSTSISYISIGFYNNEDTAPDSNLSKDEKKELLKLSRAVLEKYIREGKIIDPKDIGIKLTKNMKKERGAFVTLNKNGRLRGCIGEIFATQPLYETVIEKTIASAIHDFRFPMVTEEELDDITIEISVLTPLKQISEYKDIRIGQDGVYMIKGAHRAIFLPQVASEYGWNLETTLMHLSDKAGLSPDAWKEGATFYTYQAEVFKEE